MGPSREVLSEKIVTDPRLDGGAMPPTPKRSSERRRTNSPKSDTVPMTGVVSVPVLNLDNPHPLVVELYDSLQRSGQSQWYEPSDWVRAKITCELLSRQLWAGRVSSTMYQAIQADLAALMTCEGDRRRLRMEIERDDHSVTEDDPRVSLMQSYRKSG
jgi:hypothetical protein